MIKKLFLVSLLCCLLVCGCNSENTSSLSIVTPSSTPIYNASAKDKLTLVDIRKNYNDVPDYKFISMTKYYDDSTKCDYVLVEYINDADRYCFDWYNLKSGDRDEMPLIACGGAKLIKIRNANNLIFETDGSNTVSSSRSFSKIVECSRGKEIAGYNGEFSAIETNKYLNINEDSELGGKDNECIADIKVTLKGISVLFGPEEGNEGEFYAGHTSIPLTKISYSAEGNQLIIKFENTNLTPEIKKKAMKINNGNNYLASLYVEEDGSNIKIIVQLKETARFYTAKDGHIEPAQDDFPCIDLEFASEYKIE